MASRGGSEGNADDALDPDERARLQSESDALLGTARRQVFILIFTGFFFVLTLSGPDSQLVRADASIRWPLIQTNVQLSIFLTYAPIALVALLGYLHLLIGRLWTIRGHGIAPPEVDFLSMSSRPARLLTAFLLYWYVPLVLAWFSWRVVFRDEAAFLIAITSLVAFACAVLYHLRSPVTDVPARTRRHVALGLTGSLALAGLVLALPWGDIERASGQSVRLVDWKDPVLRLRQLDLKRANLGSVDETAIVNLGGQNLSHADARYARLIGADLRDANLSSANFRYALIGQEGSGVALVTDFERATLDRAVLQEADLRNTHFDHASLRGAELQQARLGETRFWCADLQGAALTRVTSETGDQVFQHANLDDAILSRVQLVRPNFRYASFRGADLSLAEIRGGQFGFATLDGATLVNADLRQSSFFEARLVGADLRYADLREVDFSGANLTDADLTGSYGAGLEDLRSAATLCRTTGPDGDRHDDHCAALPGPEEQEVQPSGPSAAVVQHPCARTENTGAESFLFRLHRLFTADAPNGAPSGQ